jgi:hypothetical protein
LGGVVDAGTKSQLGTVTAAPRDFAVNVTGVPFFTIALPGSTCSSTPSRISSEIVCDVLSRYSPDQQFWPLIEP